MQYRYGSHTNISVTTLVLDANVCREEHVP